MSTTEPRSNCADSATILVSGDTSRIPRAATPPPPGMRTSSRATSGRAVAAASTAATASFAVATMTIDGSPPSSSVRASTTSGRSSAINTRIGLADSSRPPREPDVDTVLPPSTLSILNHPSASSARIRVSVQRPLAGPPEGSVLRDRLPHELVDLQDHVEALPFRARANLAGQRADGVVQPGVPHVIGQVGEAPGQPPHAACGQRGEAVPAEQDRRAVVGLEHASELGDERAIDASAREVGSAIARVHTTRDPALRDQEALTLGAAGGLERDAPGLRRGEGRAVQRLKPHRMSQATAIPATVTGRPSHESIGVSEPSEPTVQP